MYTTLAFLALLGAPYIYEISSLRVKCQCTCSVRAETVHRSNGGTKIVRLEGWRICWVSCWGLNGRDSRAEKILGNNQLDALFHVSIYSMSLRVSSVTTLIISFFFSRRYNPWWVLDCFTISFHNLLSLHFSVQFLTFFFFKSPSTWWSHLSLGLPTSRDEHFSHSFSFLTVLIVSILITCAAQRNLCDFMNLTIFLAPIIRRSNCINTSSGMISRCKWLLGMPVRRELQFLMMSAVTLEACRDMK